MTSFLARFDGFSLWPAPASHTEIAGLPKDRWLSVTVKRPRSPEHHRLFFAVIARAFESWPEAHEFEPGDAEHLRAWLLCKAGYRTTTHYSLAEVPEKRREVIVTTVAAAIGQVLAGRDHAFVTPHKDGLAVHVPRSMSFEKLGQKEFNALSEAVFAIIASVLGVEVEKLKKEAEG